MPSLNYLTCTVEFGRENIVLREYDSTYRDGAVETYIAVPSTPGPFSIHLTTKNYISPGLAMFVFIDGIPQCNRSRRNLKPPSEAKKPSQTEVDLRVRQKEERVGDGSWIGRCWEFAELGEVGSKSLGGHEVIHSFGIIEVVVLRCHDSDLGYTVPSKSKIENRDDSLREYDESHMSGTDDRILGLDGACDSGKVDTRCFQTPTFCFDGTANCVSGCGPSSRRNDHSTGSTLGYDGAWDEPLSSTTVDDVLDEAKKNAYLNQVSTDNPRVRFHESNVTLSPQGRYTQDVLQAHKEGRPIPAAPEELVGLFQGQYGRHSDFYQPGRYPYYPPPSIHGSDTSGYSPYGPSYAALSGARPREYPLFPTSANIRSPHSDYVELLRERNKDNPYYVGTVGGPYGIKQRSSGGETKSDDDKEAQVDEKDAVGDQRGPEVSEDKAASNGGCVWGNETATSRVNKAAQSADVNGKAENEHIQSDQSAKQKDDWTGGNQTSADAWDPAGNSHSQTQGWVVDVKQENSQDNNLAHANAEENANTKPAKQSKKHDKGLSKEARGKSLPRKQYTDRTPGKIANVDGQDGGKQNDQTKNAKTIKQKPLDPNRPYIKRYWSNATQEWDTSNMANTDKLYVVAEEPLRPVPEKIVEKNDLSHQVQSGKGAMYYHRVARPRYIDNMQKPYAVFVFKYRSKDVLEKLLGIEIKEEKMNYRKRLQSWSREEIIEQLMKAKTAAGYATDSSIDSEASSSSSAYQIPTASQPTKAAKPRRQGNTAAAKKETSNNPPEQSSWIQLNQENPWTSYAGGTGGGAPGNW